MRNYTSIAVFFLGAIALIVPSGYSVGAILLLLGSLVLFFVQHNVSLNRQELLIIGVLATYALGGLLEAAIDGQGLSGADKPLRFLFAIPALLLVLAYPPRLAWMWAGLAIGGMAVGGWGAWQKLFMGVERASGYTHVIQFGNISMLTGVFCLAGIGWAKAQRQSGLWMVALGLGALGGVLGSLFSGSRGGWVGFPIILLVFYRGYGRDLSYLFKLSAMAVVMAGAILIYAVPQTGVQQRIHQAFDDIERYISGESRITSVGARFEMWKGATHLILEKPVFGWGDNGYERGMHDLAERGVVHPGITQFGHAHNEFIDAAAKRGMVGVLALLALYLIPMRLFMRQLHAPDLELRSLAVAGTLLPVAYIDFGLSQVFLAHNSGVMVYAFWLVVLWGSYRHIQCRLSKEA